MKLILEVLDLNEDEIPTFDTDKWIRDTIQPKMEKIEELKRRGICVEHNREVVSSLMLTEDFDTPEDAKKAMDELASNINSRITNVLHDESKRFLAKYNKDKKAGSLLDIFVDKTKDIKESIQPSRKPEPWEAEFYKDNDMEEFERDLKNGLGHWGIGDKYGVWGHDVRSLIRTFLPDLVDTRIWKDLVDEQEADWDQQEQEKNWR